MEELLQSKGFSLNTYPEGKFWELTVEDDDNLKVKICKIFNAEIEVTVNGSDVETLILQCAEDFTKCIFYYKNGTKFRYLFLLLKYLLMLFLQSQVLLPVFFYLPPFY